MSGSPLSEYIKKVVRDVATTHQVKQFDKVTHPIMLAWGYKFIFSSALRDTYTDGTYYYDIVFGMVSDIYIPMGDD